MHLKLFRICALIKCTKTSSVYIIADFVPLVNYLGELMHSAFELDFEHGNGILRCKILHLFINNILT